MCSRILLVEKYRACMLLHAVGDCMGYRNGKWELNADGMSIHKELEELGGVDRLCIEPRKFSLSKKKSEKLFILVSSADWILSDDSIMHLSNAEFLANHTTPSKMSDGIVYDNLIDYYQNAVNDMKNRGPGI